MYICYCKIVCKQHAVINEQTLWNDLRFNAAKITVLNCVLYRDNPAQYTFIATHFIKICLFSIRPFTSFLHWPYFQKFQVIFFYLVCTTQRDSLSCHSHFFCAVLIIA